MDRANAIRLLEALMAGGKYSGAPMAKAWINKKAWEIGLEGQELVSALAYAGNEGWLGNRTVSTWGKLRPSQGRHYRPRQDRHGRQGRIHHYLPPLA
jgi:hypothetical protein